MKRAITMVCCLAIVAAPMSPAMAQPPFVKALKEKYNLRSVTCFACHSKASEIPADMKGAFKEKPKTFRNAFGKAIDAQLAGKKINERMDEVKELDSDDPKKVAVTEAVTKEFLEALAKVETEKSADGETYGDLLKAGKLSGVKPKS